MAAFGQTRLQIVNAVLPRLREDPVATTSSTTYASLVATVLNTVKTQIEQAWQWRALRDTYAVTAVPGITSYALTGAGPFAQVIDAWNFTTGRELQRGTYGGFNEKFFGLGQSAVQTGDVSEYTPAGVDSNHDVQLDVWPSPTSTNTLKVNAYVPQADPTLDSTVILVPNQVLIEGMIAYLFAERGDDNGVSVQNQIALYNDMLAGVIAGEVGQDSSEADWNPV